MRFCTLRVRYQLWYICAKIFFQFCVRKQGFNVRLKIRFCASFGRILFTDVLNARVCTLGYGDKVLYFCVKNYVVVFCAQR